MIADVVTQELAVCANDWAFLVERLRADDPLSRGFGQISGTACLRGAVKAWHSHGEQSDHIVCLTGGALVVLCEPRDDSPPRSQLDGGILETPPGTERNPRLLKISPLLVHGCTALAGEEIRIVNIPTRPSRYRDPDELRFPWDNPPIPYRWPPAVTRGG